MKAVNTKDKLYPTRDEQLEQDIKLMWFGKRKLKDILKKYLVL